MGDQGVTDWGRGFGLRSADQWALIDQGKRGGGWGRPLALHSLFTLNASNPPFVLLTTFSQWLWAVTSSMKTRWVCNYFFLLIMQRHLSDSKVQLSWQVLGICRCCEEAFPTFGLQLTWGPIYLNYHWPLNHELQHLHPPASSSPSLWVTSLKFWLFLDSMTLNHSCSNSLDTSTSSIVPCAVIGLSLAASNRPIVTVA